MELLRDEELARLVDPKGAIPLFSGIDLNQRKLGTKTCQVQPSSIDLTIGRIFLPETPAKSKGGLENPLEDTILKPGETAVIVSAEVANFPPDISAFAFPPTRISAAAVLMTNPGHIDPGYSGYLNFTVINMGKSDFVLWKGDPIVTCLVVRLKSAVIHPYVNSPATLLQAPNDATLDRLSLDFLDVEQRAEDKAIEVSDKQLMKISIAGIIATLIGLVGIVVPAWLELFQPMMKLSNQVTELSSQVTEQKRRIDDISPQGPELKTAIADMEKELTSTSEQLAAEHTRLADAIQRLEARLNSVSERSSDEIQTIRSMIDELKGRLTNDRQ